MPLSKRNARSHKSNRIFLLDPQSTLCEISQAVEHDLNWDIGELDFTSLSDNRYVGRLVVTTTTN